MGKNEFNRIENFLDGKLSGSELSAFVKELDENPRLKSEVEAHRAGRLVAKHLQRAHLRTEIEHWEKGAEGTEGNLAPRRKVRKIPSLLFRYGVAATFLVFVLSMAYVFFESPKYASGIYADLNLEEPVIIERDAIAVTEETLLTIYQLYREGDYRQALELTEEQLADTERINLQFLFLSADLHYRKGHFSEAKAIYRDIMTLEGVDEWQTQRAEWNHLIISLEESPFSASHIQQLKGIAEEPDHLYSGKAQKTLEKTRGIIYRTGRFLFGRQRG